MRSLATINLASLLDTLVSLVAAFFLGGLIGYERQLRQRTAGLRTNVLVCLGAALFVDIAVRFYEIHGGPPSPLHVVAYVVSGIGFLGAGVIMREGGTVRGINTAATLWASAAVGAASGADLIVEATLGALFVLAANTLLRPVVNRINREPLYTENVEATYTLHAIAQQVFRSETLDLLESACDDARLPLRSVEVKPFGENEVEIIGIFLPSSIDGAELDVIAASLTTHPAITQAFWNSSTTE